MAVLDEDHEMEDFKHHFTFSCDSFLKFWTRCLRVSTAQSNLFTWARLQNCQIG